jgi:putative DNA primase/helicase
MGDYHRTAPIETFTASPTDRHPTELALLRGARLVTANETEDGRAWAESRIKALTGGDRVAARYMRQDFFEYDPQFKLLIAGNHRPRLRSADEAIGRRMHMVPFGVTIPERERDLELAQKLKSEWPGILSWMIAGCRAWQQQGLASPVSVTAATRDYLESEDALHIWIEECCRRGAELWTAVRDLFNSYKIWAEASGEHVGTKRQFSQRLEAHGFRPVRRDNRGFAGLTIYRASEPNGRDQDLIWRPPM